jgi:hypothetical protein
MSEQDPEQLRRAVTEAADMVKELPEHLQMAAFNKVFDAMVGTARAPLPAPTTAELPSERGSYAQARMPTPAAPKDDTDRVASLLSALDRTIHPEIRSGRPVIDLALLVLRAAGDCGQEWPTAREIARVLREKFRLRVPDSSIRTALGGAGRFVDRRPFGTGFEYRLMDDGARYLESLGDINDSNSQPKARFPRGRRHRVVSMGLRSTRGHAVAADMGEGASGETSRDANEPNAEEQTDVMQSNDTSRPPTRARSRRNGRIGPKAALEQLLNSGYFDQPRSLGEIIAYIQERRALTFSRTDMSPALIRLLREEKLERDRNADNQYQYKRPV